MNRLTFIFLCLAVISQACLPVPGPAAQGTPSPVATADLVPADGQARAQDTQAAAAASLCAVISADEALHLRQDPDPHSLHLAFLESGAVVKLISTTNPDWWKIQRGSLIGFARSKYLQKGDCHGSAAKGD